MWRAGLLLPLLFAGPALGYKPASPVRHDVFSPNGAFVLDVDPTAKRLTVYAAGNRQTPLWSFDRSVWQEEHFLSDDGRMVALVAWRFVQLDKLPGGVCVEFWNQTGLSRNYTFAELCPNPSDSYLEWGPVGDFWRKWYSQVDGDGTHLRVRTTDKYEYVFAMDDGRIVEKSRNWLPWWAWWVLSAFVICGVVGGMLILVRRRRRAKLRPLAEIGRSPS
jgi:hypothetical protein